MATLVELKPFQICPMRPLSQKSVKVESTKNLTGRGLNIKRDYLYQSSTKTDILRTIFRIMDKSTLEQLFNLLNSYLIGDLTTMVYEVSARPAGGLGVSWNSYHLSRDGVTW